MNRRGFTLLEVMMVVVVAAILFIAALPDQTAADTQRARNLAMQIEADMAYAQNMSISNPVDPVVLRVDPSLNSYWLAYQSAPDTPIVDEKTGEEHLVKTGNDTRYARVEIVGADFNGDDTLTFDGVGMLDQDVPALVQVRCGDATFEVACDPATGVATTRTAFTKTIAADTLAAATGTTRVVGSDAVAVSRDTGVDKDANATDNASSTTLLDGVGELVDSLLGR